MGGAYLQPLLPPILKVQLEVGTHPVTVGFSTVWQSFDDQSSLCFDPGSLLLCMGVQITLPQVSCPVQPLVQLV